MKRYEIFLALFIAVFLFSSVGNASAVEATSSEVSECKSHLDTKKRGKNKEQRASEDQDCRKYIDCLATQIAVTTVVEDFRCMFIDARSSGDKSATQRHKSLSGCLKESGNFMGAMVSTILDSPVMGWEG